MVRQLIADLEDIPAVNKQLDDMYAFPACLSTLAPSKDAFHPARQCCACAQALVEQSCDLRGGRGYNIGIRLSVAHSGVSPYIQFLITRSGGRHALSSAPRMEPMFARSTVCCR